MSKYQKTVSLAITISLLIAFGTAFAFGGKGKGRQAEIPRDQLIRLHNSYPYNNEASALRTEIQVRDVKGIYLFSIRSFEARDQDGNMCPFAGSYLGIMKGGKLIRLSTQIKPNISEKVIVKAEIVLNMDVINFTAVYKKSDTAGQTDDPSNDWYSIEELEEIKVTERDPYSR